MSQVLQLLLDGERLDTAQIASILKWTPAEVDAELERLIQEKVLLGWRPVINPEHADQDYVRAVIEVKISPERGGGFDRMALRISRFDEVDTCHLMSGGYDLLVYVKGQNLHNVATFISERLASIGGVHSTATHFLLRTYKEQGHILTLSDEPADRPPVSP
jgi:DNA-binding Lrp family transcriptional regulator